MSINTFWKLFFKILGIWLLMNSLAIVFPFISSIMLNFNNEIDEKDYSSFVLLPIIVIMLILVLRFFIFKPEMLVDKLKLESGFNEQRIDLNMEPLAILSIATIFVGGLTIIQSLPALCNQIYTFFIHKSIFRESPASGEIIFQLIKTLIGYLLITNSRQVAGYMLNNSDFRKNR